MLYLLLYQFKNKKIKSLSYRKKIFKLSNQFDILIESAYLILDLHMKAVKLKYGFMWCYVRYMSLIIV